MWILRTVCPLLRSLFPGKHFTTHDTDTSLLLASLSDQPTAVPSASAEPSTELAQHDSGIDMPKLELSKQATAHDTPFTLEELERAMSRATMKPREFDFGAEAGARRGGIGIAL